MKIMVSITLLTVMTKMLFIDGSANVYVTIDSSVEGELKGIIWFISHYRHFPLFY